MVKVEKTIKVDENTYKLINKYVGELRSEEKRPVSTNEALSKLLKEKKKKRDIMDFAGAWDMTNEEEKRWKEGLKRGWSSWKKPKPF
ncbi:MAG: hypothetical protein HY513_04975 [Candidatus Aenigmarchaeota archaeon]|nr:hypothetical protein [Candidatus Aenigmarchaeota archaeon]